MPRWPKFYETKSVTQLTKRGDVAAVAVSADGSHIAYAAEEGDNGSLHLVEIGSTIEASRGNNRSHCGGITFSTDKKYIYYVLNQNDVGTLYEVPFVDGDSQTVVTDVDSPVSFSPDGTHFVFERYDPVHHADLILLGDSESVSILAKVAPPVFLSGKVDWSPDGSAILFGAHDDSAVGAAKTRYGAFLLRDQKIEFGEPPLWSGE